MAKPQREERPYHHGDLRRAIVKAALEILKELKALIFRYANWPGAPALVITPLTSTLLISVSCWLLSRQRGLRC